MTPVIRSKVLLPLVEPVYDMLATAGVTGMKRLEIETRMGLSIFQVTVILNYLEALNRIERSCAGGNHTYWGIIGTAAYHKSKQRKPCNRQYSNADLPIRRKIIPASEAPRIKILGPVTVFLLADFLGEKS
jgi:hypothetical protein